jgi:hypothetical protein
MPLTLESFITHCDKCKEEAPLAVICKECRDEICAGCALNDEKRQQMCFACLDKKEAELDRTIHA